MFTVDNIRKSVLKEGYYCISIRGKFKFNISRTMKSLTENDFINLANKKFYEKYQTNWKGVCIGAKRLTKFEKIINNRWASINQRCVNGKYSKSNSVHYSPQFKSYHKQNITVNMAFGEFESWMKSVEHVHNEIISVGEKSSVDRIDETKGYEIGNLQLISLHSNIEKRYKTSCKFQPEEQKHKKRIENQKYYLKNKELKNGI